MFPDFQKAIKIIRDRIPDVRFIYVFGSFADATTHPESDIDLAFYSPVPSDDLSVWETEQAIASVYNKDVDLVDMSKAGDVLKMEIICKGEIVYNISENDRGFFESRIVEDYMDYKEWVRPIEEEIVKSGSVF
jgi:predicted nucleotidyltransferase